MKYWNVAALVLAISTTALAQDPARNRMNDSYPKFRHEATAVHPSPDPFGNRMNVRYEEGSAKELTGGPSPYSNRMNVSWWTAPKPIEQKPVDPQPVEPTIIP